MILTLVMLPSLLLVEWGRRRLRGATRLFWGLFVGSYVVTTMLGATIIAMPGGIGVLAEANPTLGLGPISHGVRGTYWVLLVLPLWIVTLPLVLASRVSLPWEGAAQKLLSARALGKASLAPAAVITAGLAAYSIQVAGLTSLFLGVALAIGGAGEHALLIVLRSSMVERLGSTFYYQISYVGLPSLAWVSLYQYWTRKSRPWGALAVVQVLLVVFLQLGSIQKMPTLVFGLGIYFAWALLRGVRVRAMLAWSFSGIVILTLLQQAYTVSWSVRDSIVQVIFRMAAAFPYYVEVYPRILPFQEHNFGLGLFGIGVSPIDNLQIFNQMYRIDLVQGSAAAAVHLRAYSHGGMHWAVFALIVVALYMRLVSRISAGVMNPIKYAFLVQSGLTIYYFTQTSLRGALLESYGIRWAVVVLVLLSVASQLQSVDRSRFLGQVASPIKPSPG